MEDATIFENLDQEYYKEIYEFLHDLFIKQTKATPVKDLKPFYKRGALQYELYGTKEILHILIASDPNRNVFEVITTLDKLKQYEGNNNIFYMINASTLQKQLETIRQYNEMDPELSEFTELFIKLIESQYRPIDSKLLIEDYVKVKLKNKIFKSGLPIFAIPLSYIIYKYFIQKGLTELEIMITYVIVFLEMVYFGLNYSVGRGGTLLQDKYRKIINEAIKNGSVTASELDLTLLERKVFLNHRENLLEES